MLLNTNFIIAESWRWSSSADFTPAPRAEALSPGTTAIDGWSDDMRLTTTESQVPLIVNDVNGLHLIWKDFRDNWNFNLG